MFPLRDSEHSNTFPLITLLIIAVNAIVFWLELTSQNLEVFITSYALIPSRVQVTDPSTFTPFLTSMFLHGGFIHILSNMWFLWVFGDNAEATFGHIRFLIFYLASGIAASLVQFFLQEMMGSSIDIPMLGASGAIAGVLGAYLVFFPHAKIETLIPFFGFATVTTIAAPIMLVYWFITQLFNSVASVVSPDMMGGVAFGAHVGGFVFGWLIASIFYGPQRKDTLYDFS